jgi:polyisoprenoid-binding protein YceI
MGKTQWTIDPVHSEIEFKVRHLLISNITGRFRSFHASLESSKDDFTDAQITFEAETNSVTTGNDMRDGQLRGDDFFNAEKFPYLRFVSKDVKKVSDNKYKLTGDISIRDVTKPIVLDVTYNGQMLDSQKNTKAGFEITGRLNRKEFGLKWNGITDTGTIVASDEVDLDLNIQMKKVA